MYNYHYCETHDGNDDDDDDDEEEKMDTWICWRVKLTTTICNSSTTETVFRFLWVFKISNIEPIELGSFMCRLTDSHIYKYVYINIHNIQIIYIDPLSVRLPIWVILPLGRPYLLDAPWRGSSGR